MTDGVAVYNAWIDDCIDALLDMDEGELRAVAHGIAEHNKARAEWFVEMLQDAIGNATKPPTVEDVSRYLEAKLCGTANGKVEIPVIVVANTVAMLQRVPVECAIGGLTPTEQRIYDALKRNAGKVVSRSTLLQCTWAETNGTLEVHISRLREKIAPTGEAIAVIRGRGYSLANAATNGADGD